jgi:hypothetical protein
VNDRDNDDGGECEEYASKNVHACDV